MHIFVNTNNLSMMDRQLALLTKFKLHIEKFNKSENKRRHVKFEMPKEKQEN